MNSQKMIRKLSAALLATTMATSSFTQFSIPVFAQEKEVEKGIFEKMDWMTPEDIKSYKPENPDEENEYVLFGSGRSEKDRPAVWRILGSHDNNIILLSTQEMVSVNEDREMKYKQPFDDYSEKETKPYDTSWDCNYQGFVPTEVAINHYGGSRIRRVLKKIEQDNFTEAERRYMRPTTIYTEDMNNNTVYSTTDILYLPYDNPKKGYITLGANTPDNLYSGISIFHTNGYENWLRTPHESKKNAAYYYQGGGYHKVKWNLVYRYTNGGGRIFPAFEYDISDLLFASNTPLPYKDTAYLGHEGYLVPRFRTEEDLGSAQVSYDKMNITVKGVPKNKTVYLMVGYDNEGSLYTAAKRITEDTIVSVDDMIPGYYDVPNFEGCKVWLETRPAGGGLLSYAEMADWEQGYDVNVVASEGLNVTDGVQGVAKGSPITDIKVEVVDGYYLRDDYISDLKKLPWNKLEVTKTDNGFIISGTPENNVNITLPPLALKPGSGSGSSSDSGSGSGSGGLTHTANPVYRAYNPNNGEHLYTLDAKEFKHITSNGWHNEGIAFMAETERNGRALYRVYNPNSGLHHFTLDENEKNVLVSLGWNDENIAWYTSKNSQSKPVYRVYNPNDGNHLHTIDAHEKDVLVSLGWQFEGLAFRTAPIEK